jgi:membrane-associated phospholipid phosphatase
MRPPRGRFAARHEVALALGAYALYLIVARPALSGSGRRRSARNARRLVALEERLGLHHEPRLQALLLPRRRLLALLNACYVTLNIVLTVGSLALLYRRRHPAFHRLRRAAVLGTLAAQPLFLLFPTDPPRSLDHLVDTMLDVTGVDLDSGPIVWLYNPKAAFPSIHMLFAVVTAAAVREAAGRRELRAAAAAYPPAVAFTVLVTANHYVLDVAAGTLLGGASLRAAGLLERRP